MVINKKLKDLLTSQKKNHYFTKLNFQANCAVWQVLGFRPQGFDRLHKVCTDHVFRVRVYPVALSGRKVSRHSFRAIIVLKGAQYHSFLHQKQP